MIYASSIRLKFALQKLIKTDTSIETLRVFRQAVLRDHFFVLAFGRTFSTVLHATGICTV